MNTEELFLKLKSNPKNPRKHTNEDISRIIKKIREFPEMLEKRPVVYDKDYIIIGGNLRYKGIKSLLNEGFALKAEYFSCAIDWSEEQIRQFIALDNISDGEWDLDLLAQQYTAPELEEWGLGVLSDRDSGETKEDEAPEVSNELSTSQLGEIYQLGRHKLICGDATKSEDVGKLMGGVLADMIFTDPPYNVDYEGKTKEKLKIENDKMENEEFYNFLYNAYFVLNEYSKKGAAIYVCHADSERVNFTLAYQKAGWKLAQVIIWAKQQFVMGRQDYHWQHEPILYGWKEGAGHYFVDDRTQTTLWNIDRPSQSKEHPTMKPIALVARAIKNNTKEGDIVLDTFGGSGSTLIACEQTGRISYISEIDPRFCDVIRRRYWKFTHEDNEEGWIEGTKN